MDDEPTAIPTFGGAVLAGDGMVLLLPLLLTLLPLVVVAVAMPSLPPFALSDTAVLGGVLLLEVNASLSLDSMAAYR